jgi:hypothetical protein
MPAPRESQARRYLLSCLLLLSAGALSAGALAEVRDVRMHGPNGDGGSDCTEADAADASTTTATTTKQATASPAKPANSTRIKPVVTVRGGDDGTTHAARWHSFLPGMFR